VRNVGVEMFKKFNHNLNHNPVGVIFGISLSMLLGCLFNLAIPQEGIIPKIELTIILLSFSTIFNLVVSTYIIIKGEIKQVNVTYVCPTARKYLSEQEIEKIEKTVEEEIKKDVEYGEEMIKAYKEI